MNSLEMSASFSKSKMRNRKIRALFSDSTRLTNPYEMSYAIIVITLTASDARERLYRLLDETAEAHEPVLITGPRSNAVLVSEKDWNAMQETVYLLSVPGMRESIRLGMATPLEECDGTPGW